MTDWKSDLQKLLIISRPRFWLYVFGPFLLGIAAAYDKVITPLLLQQNGTVILLFALYFTLPANLLIYGVNDISDNDTDSINPKKDGYETRVYSADHRWVWIRIAALNVPFVFAALFLNSPAILAIMGFAGLGIFYSAEPVRLKTKPFLDSFSNILYAMPGFLSYALFTGLLPTWWAFVGALAWCAAMHAFSAIPDIDADRDARLKTIATTLEFRGTLVFCATMYTIAALCSIYFLSWFFIVPLAVYLFFLYLAFRTGKYQVMSIYKLFPIINAAMGMFLFGWILVSKLL